MRQYIAMCQEQNIQHICNNYLVYWACSGKKNILHNIVFSISEFATIGTQNWSIYSIIQEGLSVSPFQLLDFGFSHHWNGWGDACLQLNTVLEASIWRYVMSLVSCIQYKMQLKTKSFSHDVVGG